MKISIRQIFISVSGILIAVAIVAYMATNAVSIGNQALPVRALILSVAVVAAMVAVYPLNLQFAGRPKLYFLFVCVPAVLPGLVYYLWLLPQQAGAGLEALQLRSELITDRSSNGFVEVGFSYPIFTPTITITNPQLFTTEVNVFLRIIDSNNETNLFRAVRQRIPSMSLSVEATVQGMLSENPDYLFIPVAVPPMRSVTGKVVFIISNLDDGSTFTEALGRAYQASFELRDPATAELLLEFPLNHL